MSVFHIYQSFATLHFFILDDFLVNSLVLYVYLVNRKQAQPIQYYIHYLIPIYINKRAMKLGNNKESFLDNSGCTILDSLQSNFHHFLYFYKIDFDRFSLEVQYCTFKLIHGPALTLPWRYWPESFSPKAIP